MSNEHIQPLLGNTGLIVAVCKELQTIDINRGISFYRLHLDLQPTDDFSDFYDVADVYNINKMIERKDTHDPVYAAVKPDGTTVALPFIPGTHITAPIRSIEHLRDEF